MSILNVILLPPTTIDYVWFIFIVWASLTFFFTSMFRLSGTFMTSLLAIWSALVEHERLLWLGGTSTLNISWLSLALLIFKSWRDYLYAAALSNFSCNFCSAWHWYYSCLIRAGSKFFSRTSIALWAFLARISSLLVLASRVRCALLSPDKVSFLNWLLFSSLSHSGWHIRLNDSL